MNEAQSDTVAASGAIAWRLRKQDLPGWWGKRLAIQPQHMAVARWPGGTELLDPQTFDFGAPGGRPAPEDLLLVYVGPLDIALRLPDLLSRDGQLLTVEGRLRGRIAAPLRLEQCWPAGSERLDGPALAALAAGALRSGAAALVRNQDAADLSRPLGAADLAAQLRALSADALAGLGLTVEGLTAVTATPAAEALRQDEARAALQGALGQQAARARLAASGSQADMERAVRQIAHELHLENALREQELLEVAGAEWVARQAATAGAAIAGSPGVFPGAIGSVGTGSGVTGTLTSPGAGAPTSVAADGLGSPNAAAAAADLPPEEPLCTLEQLYERLERLIERVGGSLRPDISESTGGWLKATKATLDVVGAVITATATIAGRQLSDLLKDIGLPESWAPWIRLAAAVVTAILVWRTYGRFRPAPARLMPATGGGAPRRLALPADRRLAEELVRKNLAAALLRVQADLTRATDAAFRVGAEVATPLRLLRVQAAELSKELAYALVQARHSRYMQGEDLQLRLLQDMLGNEEALLVQAERLEDLGRRLYEGVIDGDLPSLEAPRRDLDKALRETQGRLIRRTAILAG